MMDMFDLTNLGKRKSSDGVNYKKRRIPEVVSGFLRLFFFLVVILLGIKVKKFAPCVLFGILTVWQIIMIIKYFKKRKKEKQEEKGLSEEDFMKQIDKQFGEANAEIKSENVKLQNRFNNSEYNEDSDEPLYEEYDLTEELEKQSGQSFGNTEGF